MESLLTLVKVLLLISVVGDLLDCISQVVLAEEKKLQDLASVRKMQSD